MENISVHAKAVDCDIDPVAYDGEKMYFRKVKTISKHTFNIIFDNEFYMTEKGKTYFFEKMNELKENCSGKPMSDTLKQKVTAGANELIEKLFASGEASINFSPLAIYHFEKDDFFELYDKE